MDDLVLDNINLIYFVIKKMGLYYNAEYYYDIGLMALIRAAARFDESKGYKFSTFAAKYIRLDILKDIRISNSNKCKANNNTISLYTPIKEDRKEIFLIDSIPSDFNVEEYVIEKEKRELVHEAISMLDVDEQVLIKFYFGADDKITQKDIAKALNMSQPLVSRKINRIIKKLQKRVKGEML